MQKKIVFLILSINMLSAVMLYGYNKTSGIDQALIDAAKAGNLAKVRELVERGAAINLPIIEIKEMLMGKVDEDYVPVQQVTAKFYENDALIEAIIQNKTDVAKFLIERRADVNRKYGRYESQIKIPINQAAKNNNLELVRLLAEKGANLSQKDGEYLTPLGYAIVNNNVPMLEYLLSKGVKSDEIIHQYEAIRHKNLSANMLVYLLNKGLNPDVLLQKAASINDITGIEVALNKGAKPDQVLYDALRYNWLQNRDKLIRLTIDKVDPTTVLLWATQFGDGQIAKDILKKNVDPNKKNENGETALFLALKNGLFDIVKDLVQNQKTDVLIKDKEGNTALILAVTKNAPSEVIQLLLNRGIKINEQNNEGNTALIVAVMNGNKETVSRLIGAGADVTLKNKNGATAHSFAITRGYGDLAKILEEAEKNMGR